MGKATIVIEDVKDTEVNFQTEFDPPIKEGSDVTPAQAVAIALLVKLKDEGLDQALTPFNAEPKPEQETETDDRHETD